MRRVLGVDPLRRQVLSYAWLPSLLCLRACSADLNALLLGDHALMQELVNVLLSPSGRSVDDPEVKLSLWDVIALGSRLTTWPVGFVPCAAIGSGESWVEVVGRLCSYAGPEGDGGCVVATDHWPVVGRSESLAAGLPACLPPFTKIHVDPETRRKRLTSSCIAYFEVTLLRTDRQRTHEADLQRRADELAGRLGPGDVPELFVAPPSFLFIGLCRPGYTRAPPGTDAHSLALRDDGTFVCDQHAFGCDVERIDGGDLSFTTGDTVGLGLVYDTRGQGQRSHTLFLTKNGTMAALVHVDVAQMSCMPWFPCVYWHSHFAAAEVNFGERVPFAFDLFALEQAFVFSSGMEGYLDHFRAARQAVRSHGLRLHALVRRMLAGLPRRALTGLRSTCPYPPLACEACGAWDRTVPVTVDDPDLVRLVRQQLNGEGAGGWGGDKGGEDGSGASSPARSQSSDEGAAAFVAEEHVFSCPPSDEEDGAGTGPACARHVDSDQIWDAIWGAQCSLEDQLGEGPVMIAQPPTAPAPAAGGAYAYVSVYSGFYGPPVED